MKLRIDAKLKKDYPDMDGLLAFISNVEVKRDNKSLEVFKENVYQSIRLGLQEKLRSGEFCCEKKF